jgi:hypothetical protein
MMGEVGADPTAKLCGTPALIRRGLVSRARVTAADIATSAEAAASAASTVLSMVSGAAARSSESA